MSAPIAVIALAGAAILPLTSSILNPLLAEAPVGMWAKASISPLSELAWEAGEAEPTHLLSRLVLGQTMSPLGSEVVHQALPCQIEQDGLTPAEIWPYDRFTG